MIEREYWTIVFSDHPENKEDGIAGYPVRPIDCNTHEDEGMLVYCSENAAVAAAIHQHESFGVHCCVVKLGNEKQ